jgi:phosphoserine phosphatase RsbU/P
MKILVVDDSDDARDITEAALRSGGFSALRSASSAAEAYDCLGIGKAEAPFPADLILLDIVMPDVDGIQACAHIRSDPRYADVPIIMVSSLNDPDSLADAMKAGANGYVGKPLNRGELVARVRAALQLKGEIDRRKDSER